MNRKQFIASHGATCRNWTWSWSFINEKTRTIIFGALDVHTQGNTALILSQKWGSIFDEGYKFAIFKAMSRSLQIEYAQAGYHLTS